MDKFQSTLPRGSDFIDMFRTGKYNHFNPRSLAGATSLRPLVQLFAR